MAKVADEEEGKKEKQGLFINKAIYICKNIRRGITLDI